MKTQHIALWRLSALTLGLASAGLYNAALAQPVSTEVGTVTITGAGDRLANGLLIDEEGVKARSTVTRSAIEKERPSANPFQLLNLQPGVNASSQDATGLFGGNLRVRGFNADQMGFTINGAPVNDSGNFAVYPQEYTDSENLCEIFVTQGAADTDAPHVGASGGNVGLVSCSPKEQFGLRFSQSVGELGFSRTFMRVDTGTIGSDVTFKGYASYSKSEVDKFKGMGGADREHVDLGFESSLTPSTSLSGSLVYNRAVNNNIRTLSKAQWLADPRSDFSNEVPQHLAAGNENVPTSFGTSATKPAYYGYSLNPFENYLFTARLQSRVDDKLTLSAEPYFWYGYGTGGTQQNTLAESAVSGTRLNNGIGDINRNGLLTDTVGVWRGSLTETHRPGITLKANYELDNHRILAGLWFEHADHRQSQPATSVDNAGNIGDIWLRDNLVTYNNGQVYQGRNYKTVSTGSSYFVTDQVAVGDLELVPGLRYTEITRDFTNYASSGSGMGADYQASRTWGKLLPSFGARYKLDDATQVYGNVTKNMRAPSNWVMSGWVNGGTYSNGVLNGYTLKPNTSVQAETAINTEAGMRFSGQGYNAQFALFQVDFRNRLASGYNPDTATSTDYNFGSVRMRGLELQAGTKPSGGWSYFGSLTYTQSRVLSDYTNLVNGTPVTTLTAGNQFPDTPKWMAGASVQYATGPYLAALSAKYVGKRYTTLTNDAWLDGYTVFDFSAGYRFPSGSFMKNPTLRLNVSNLFDKKYLNANSGSGSSIGISDAAGTQTYYVGAPRFTSVTFSSDF